MDPYFRSHRTPVFKTDHPTMAYKNEGHLLNDSRVEFIERQRARASTAWEPPAGGEARKGKKILGTKPVNDGKVMEEFD